MVIRHSEFFKNIKKLPPPGTKEYEDLVNWEIKKITEGVTFAGVFIPGWLYWHTNHWHITVDAPDGSRVTSRPELRDNEWIRAEALEKCRLEGKAYFEAGARQGGKALRDDQVIHTKDGLLPIKDAYIGLEIYDESGGLTKVTGVFPQGLKPCYKLTLEDHRTVYADGDHLWYVKNLDTQEVGVKKTTELLGGNYALPDNKPVEYAPEDLPHDPYFLGLYMGGGLDNPHEEIQDYLSDYAQSLGISKGELLKITPRVSIPRGSLDQRMSFLQGLMDSNGDVDDQGTIYLNKVGLDQEIMTLLRSLGIQCWEEGDRIILKTWFFVFRLGYKLDKIKIWGMVQHHTKIASIERVEDAHTTCITVDNESHLFLCQDFIVTHNSEMEASYLAMNAIIYENSQNIVVGSNDGDLSLIKAKIDFGLQKLWSGIKIPKLDKTWRGSQMRLGYKRRDGEDEVWSYIIIRNTNAGTNTEVVAGTTAKSFIIDEAAKAPFSKVYEASKPAFIGKYGMRAVPIVVCTGGSAERSEDAERVFYHPEENGFLSFTDEQTGDKTALFMSGIYRQDCKVSSNLYEFLTKERGLEFSDNQRIELSKLKMSIADKEKARKVILKNREIKKNDPDYEEYLKSIMYFPLTPRECFMSSTNSIFNTQGAEAQKLRLIQEKITGNYGFLYHSGEEIKWDSSTTKKPISSFPHKHSVDKDAPIVIWEHPIKDPPHGLYTAGVDSYRAAESDTSSSLGAVYIFKRVHNLYDEKFKNQFVASYVARPKDKDKWNNQARLLIKYYNARTLVENDEMSFIDYMINQGDARYLEPEPQYLKAFVKNSTVNRPYGIHRSAEAIRYHLHETFKKYMDTVIYQERDEQGSVIKEFTGMYQILDPMLLEEIIKYDASGEKIDNFDRIVAAELALSLGDYLNRTVNITDEPDPYIESYFNRKKKHRGLFTSKRGIFSKKPNLF